MNISCTLKNPTGTRDLKSNDVKIREYIFDIAKKCFDKRCAIQIDTPIFELYSLVQNLYGEEFNKLVYKLEDGGSQELILRYDMTVPLARYIAMNGLKFLRRYQIGKVYRRDDPQIEKGRFREFYQCDFDIVGDDQDTNIFDIEILDTLIEILEKLLGNNFTVKINDRKILYNLLRYCKVEDNYINTVCSTLDKLDKKSWSELKLELENKNINNDIIKNLENIINEINNLNNIKNNSDQINAVLTFLNNINIDVKSIKNIFDILTQINLIKYMYFDLSLARGLDYYTGMIFEVKYNNTDIMESTICSGGRYDKIIGKLANQGDVPAVGLSLGVERIAAILEKTINFTPNKPQIYIASIGNNMITEKIKLCSKFRKMGFICIMSHLSNPKMRPQFDEVFNMDIPYMVIIGENEIKENKLTIKDVKLKNQYILDKQIAIDFLVERIENKVHVSQ